MRSPCHNCNLSKADKNERICMECDKRVAYVAALGCFPAGPETGTLKKRGEAMSIKGTCGNCHREDMSLPAAGMCGRCNYAVKHAPPGGEEAALAVAADNAASGKSRKYTAKKKPQNQGPGEKKPEPVTYKASEGWLAPTGIGVCLEFKDDRDKGIFKWIEELAEDHRRNPEQQIMWILQDYIDTVNKLSEQAK
ncbi:MAG: hypothetical protein Q8M56_09980 [Desulfobacterales bacterium]|nr:hypothetical protein [Desulfobacterales bacterium]